MYISRYVLYIDAITYMHVCTHACTHARIRTYVHTYIHTHTYTYKHIHTHTYTYIHIHTHTYTYIHIHTHTYIHRHILTQSENLLERYCLLIFTICNWEWCGCVAWRQNQFWILGSTNRCIIQKQTATIATTLDYRQPGPIKIATFAYLVSLLGGGITDHLDDFAPIRQTRRK